MSGRLTAKWNVTLPCEIGLREPVAEGRLFGGPGEVVQMEGGTAASRKRAMLNRGVIPTPPATRTERGADRSSGKRFTGAPIVRRSPGFTRSSIQAEPPREAGCRFTAMV
jgi:hypothetical protein